MASEKSGAYLNKAAKAALATMKKGHGGPFGAVIVRKGRVIATATNTVLKNQDATRHAEINAIQAAARKIGRFSLHDCDIYSTTEPCPMCFSAIHWSRIPNVIYSTTINDVHALGFNELTLPCKTMKSVGKSPVKLQRVKNSACAALLKEWARLENKNTY